MSDFDWYRLFKTLHVIGVTMLAAGIGLEMVSGPMLSKARSVQDVRLLARLMVVGEQFLILPAFAVIAVFGYATADRLNISVGTTWLVIAQVLFYTAGVIGLGYLRKEAHDLLVAAEAVPDGAIPPELAGRMKNPLPAIAGSVLTIFFLTIVYLMVSKPNW